LQDYSIDRRHDRPLDRPLVGVICCTLEPVGDPVQGVAERYLRAGPLFGADLVLVPSMPELVDARRLVQRLDGILLTGSPSNVQPRRYGSDDAGDGPFDLARDATAQVLIESCAERDRPLLAICRGFQEVAVTFGATLRRDLGDRGRQQVHHGPDEATLEELFENCHRVDLTPGGVLARAMRAPSITVNSAHYQGIARLGDGLAVEATSHDGVIESVRPRQGARLLAVQWHPEWKAESDPNALRLFRLFGALLRGAALDEAADLVGRDRERADG